MTLALLPHVATQHDTKARRCRVFTCVGLGAPWLILNISSGSLTVTTTVTLSKWSTVSCPGGGAACTTQSGTTMGSAKAAGDPVLGLLTLTLLSDLHVFIVSLITLFSLGKIGTGPIGMSRLTWLRNHAVVVTLVTLACCIAYPATVLPGTSGFPGSNGDSISYGGGFGCALVSFLFMLPCSLVIQAMKDEEASFSSGVQGGGAIHPSALPYAVPAVDPSVGAAATAPGTEGAKFSPYADAKVGEYATGGFQAGSY